MPNYNLGSRFPEELTRECSVLSGNCVRHATAGFPLTADEIEQAACKPDVLERLIYLKEKGIAGLPGTGNLIFALDPKHTPGLQRVVGISATLRRRIFSSIDDMGGSYGDKIFFKNKLPTQILNLPPEKHDALVKWVHRVLKEERLKEMTDRTVMAVVSSCKSTAHLMARWPFLTTIVKEWRPKFQVAPKKLGPWAPSEGWMNTYRKRMEASEVVLNKGMFLGEYKEAPEVVLGRIVAWERLPNDPTWS